MTNQSVSQKNDNKPDGNSLFWSGPLASICTQPEHIQKCLLNLQTPLYALHINGQPAFTNQGRLQTEASRQAQSHRLLASVPALRPQDFGDPAFRDCYKTEYACYAGAMAHGIASEELVIAMSQAGFLASFGAAGLSPHELEEAIQRIQSVLADKPFAVNLIHTPANALSEMQTIEVILKHDVSVVEASAFIGLTQAIVWYRAAGLRQNPDGSLSIDNHILAKLSRTEVAEKFLQPAPLKLLDILLEKGLIDSQQHRLAQQVPLADDITVEADSGGHTDNRPLVCLFPAVRALRDELQEKYHFAQPVRIGAAGGISTPSAALAAFMMGADYITTGSVNQACIEAGTSAHVLKLLAQAGMADVVMAPSADMFEMGVKVQVLKKGTLYPMRAQKLYDLYTKYGDIDALPPAEREKLEKQIFQNSLEEVWQDTARFFAARNPQLMRQAEENPRRKMALLFRWYLGQSSRWATGEIAGREMDYQVWCGPSMGSFNDWVRGTCLEEVNNRRVAEVNRHILLGCAYQLRIQQLKLQGVPLPTRMHTYRPPQQDCSK